MTSAIVPLADGVEEMEAVIVIDVLRRAGWHVVSASIGRTAVKASRGVTLVADASWDDVDTEAIDVLVLPGGAAGTQALCADQRVLTTVREFTQRGKTVAAICAAPLVLQAAGVVAGRQATCHPAVREELTSARVSTERVVTDGNLITSQGPGTAFEFALALVAMKDGPAKAGEVARGLVLR